MSERDADRLGYHLKMSATLERDERQLTAMTALMAGGSLTLAGAGVWIFASKQSQTTYDLDTFGQVYVGLGAGLLILGAASMLMESESETLFADYQLHDFSTEATRAASVLQTEALWQARVDDYATAREVGGWLGIELGGTTLVLGIVGAVLVSTMVTDPDLQIQLGMLSGSIGALGAGLIGIGIYGLTTYRHPVERTWELYQDQRSSFSNMPEAGDFEVNVAPSGMGQGGVGLSVFGQF